MSELEGSVGKVIYQSDGYYVFEFSNRNNPLGRLQVTTVSGNMFGLTISSGVHVRLTGNFVQNPKFGLQFVPDCWAPWAPDLMKARDFLCNGIGCSRRTAVLLTECLGEDTLQILGDIQKNPRTLSELGTTDKERDDLAAFQLSWEKLLAKRDFAHLLSVGGFTSREIGVAFNAFGHELHKIRENPYLLAATPGLKFPKLDALARGLGVTDLAVKRAQGGVLLALQQALNDGHLYQDRVALETFLSELTGVSSFDYFSLPGGLLGAAQQLAEQGLVKVDAGKVYLNESFKAEDASASALAERAIEHPMECLDVDGFVTDYEAANKLELSTEQKRAISLLATHRVLVVTGLPGTGKTAVIRAFVDLFSKTKSSYHLMAPTGIAAKRLSDVTGTAAMTIHRTLKYNGVSWGHDRNNRFVVDAVVIDEMSMVDQALIHQVLEALPEETRIILVGDDAQLPSVGAGNVLRELANCPSIPTIRLTQIFRQAALSNIVLSSHSIHQGNMPELADLKGPSDFKFVPMTDEDRVLDFVVGMAKKYKSKDANFQVLSPKYAGAVGVDSLNLALRDAINPTDGRQAAWSGKTMDLRVGDRVMVIMNDYKKGVFNGDVGKVMQVTRSGKEHGVLVKIFGAGIEGTDLEVMFPDAEVASKLKLAFAVTVHKCQGQEFDVIIMPLMRSQGIMLQRNLLYTAVTRAKKQVWLIGDIGAFHRAVGNNPVIHRRTMLGSRITEYVSKLSAQV